MTKRNIDTSRVQDLVDRLQEEKRIDALGPELERLVLAAPNEREARDLDFYRGIAAFRRGDRSAAFALFKAADARHPGDAEILFSLGQEHEFRGERDAMLACLRRAPFPKVPSSYVLMSARYCYLWDKPEDGLAFLEPFFAAYLALGVPDDHFVYVRGLPFLSETWDTALVFWKELGRLDEARRRLDDFRGRLPDFYDEPVALALEALATGDDSALVERARRLAEEDGTFRPYFQLQAAVRESLRAEPSEGLRRLRAFAVNDPPFAWLEDMRALGLAACARRAGADAGNEEEDCLRRFFAAQPMMFEPRHPLNFGLLAYQETLKPRYRATRTRAAA